jgi:AAA family ATP:ADP antiporter
MRALRLIGDVRPRETGRVLLLQLNLFVLMAGYYVLKTVREPLVLLAGGAELRAYASLGQALLLVAFIPAFGWLASRVDRLRLLTVCLVFFAACIEVFHVGLLAHLPGLGIVFFVWVGIFNLAAISLFWSYANDLYRPEEGARLFPVIAVGAVAGSPVGSRLAERLFAGGVGIPAMLHLAAALLLVHLLLYRLIDRDPRLVPRAATRAEIPGPGGFRLVLRSRYLRLFAALLLVLNFAKTTGDYIVARAAKDAADAAARLDPHLDRAAFLGEFYGGYFFWVDIAALALQVLVASRLVRRWGVAGVALAQPLAAAGAYATIGAGAGLTAMRWVKTAENAADYSLMNTARHMLWLPTSRAEKYKAKQALDTFFVRAGDLLSAGLVLFGTHVLPLGLRSFALVNLGAVLVWLLLTGRVLREHRSLRLKAGDAEQRPDAA